MSQQRLEVECARLQERYEENPTGRVFAPLSDVLRKLGRNDEALRVCQTGLARHPEYSSAHVILGKIHLERGDEDAAAGAFREVLELDDENLLALRHLARLHEEDGEVDEALRMWRRVARIEPDAEAVEERIEALERRQRGEPEEAVAEEPEAEVEEKPAPAADDTEDATAEVEDADVEETEVAAEAPAPEAEAPVPEAEAPVPEAEDPAPEVEPASGSTKASSAEIATITLAQIYYEQGFLAKALEVYEQIHARNPDLEGLAERVEAIRQEVASQGPPRAETPAEADLDDLAPDREEPIARDSSARSYRSESTDSDGDTEVSVEIEHEQPMTRRMEASSEKERFENFRRWLDGISADDPDHSQ